MSQVFDQEFDEKPVRGLAVAMAQEARVNLDTVIGFVEAGDWEQAFALLRVVTDEVNGAFHVTSWTVHGVDHDHDRMDEAYARFNEDAERAAQRFLIDHHEGAKMYTNLTLRTVFTGGKPHDHDKD